MKEKVFEVDKDVLKMALKGLAIFFSKGVIKFG
jgi:hypothetical protein